MCKKCTAFFVVHLYAIEQPNNDLQETGTIDKLTFVRLCGPPPGMKSNKVISMCPIKEHYKSDFGGHFMNHCRLGTGRVTSKV